MNTSTIRSNIKEKRLSLSLDEQEACSGAIAAQICAQSFFKESQHIAFYLPMKGEVGTQQIIQVAQQAGKQCYLPVLAQDDVSHLWFMPFDGNSVFVNNRFGIPEPTLDMAHLFPASALDLVITPLVAFDAQCHRIGMGAGFYDRTFAFLQTSPRPAKPLLCGLAYGFQEVNDIHPQSWDVVMNYVITEESCFSGMML